MSLPSHTLSCPHLFLIPKLRVLSFKSKCNFQSVCFEMTRDENFKPTNTLIFILLYMTSSVKSFIITVDLSFHFYCGKPYLIIKKENLQWNIHSFYCKINCIVHSYFIFPWTRWFHFLCILVNLEDSFNTEIIYWHPETWS
jgi:hypothetical protein